MKQTKIQELLNRKMDRREFLKVSGAALLSVIGVSNLMRTLGEQSSRRNSGSQEYGTSAYGGKKRG